MNQTLGQVIDDSDLTFSLRMPKRLLTTYMGPSIAVSSFSEKGPCGHFLPVSSLEA